MKADIDITILLIWHEYKYSLKMRLKGYTLRGHVVEVLSQLTSTMERRPSLYIAP